MHPKILPSLLAGHVGRLEAEARRAEAAGGDGLHVDIMDGVFVPNISFGPDVVEMARQILKIPLSVHLMLHKPDAYVNRFADAGADSILIHIETECDVPAVLERIRDLGVRPGITLNPNTPPQMVYPVLDRVDEILCMTVHPGYGGQSFMPEVLPKIRELRAEANRRGLRHLDILVDGGIDCARAAACAAAGANVFVAGTSLYRAADMAAEIVKMRSAVQPAG